MNSLKVSRIARFCTKHIPYPFYYDPVGFIREKGRDLTQSDDKSYYSNRKTLKAM